jgi:hypothetical protein
MLRTLLAIAVCTLSVISLSAASVARASPGEIYQCGGRANYFDGWTDIPNFNSYAFEGASAYIVNQFGAVCDTDRSAPNPGNSTTGTNFTSAWVMIASYNAQGWAQTGITRGYDSPQYEFAEFTPSRYTGPFYNRFPSNPSLANGVKHAYRALWTSTCACIVMSIDGVEVTQTNFDPYQIWYAGPHGDQFSPEFSGEASYLENDIPGVPYAKTAFEALGAQQYSNIALVPMPCIMAYLNSNPARWAASASNCTNFDIWTSNTG